MAFETSKRVLIFGATGVIGRYIIQEVVNAKSSFEKIGLFTSPETARNKPDEISHWEEKGVDIHVGDVNSEEDVKKVYEGTFEATLSVPFNALIGFRIRYYHLSPRP